MTEMKSPRVVIVSGTPGVGKTSVCSVLRKRGFNVFSLNKFILKEGLYYGFDYTRESVIIDEELLKLKLREVLSNFFDLVFVEGHTSELVPKEFVSLVIVLRCNPGVLRKRLLLSRNYPKQKVVENIRAEIMDECLLSAKEKFPSEIIFEIDSTELPLDQIVDKIEKLAKI